MDERGLGTFERRALTLQEAQRLLNVAPPGPYRLIYVLALSTGLRRAEMESLRWGDIVLEGEQPYLRVRARFTKNRKDAFIPLISQTAEALRSVRPAGVSGDVAVLPKGVPRNRRALRRDMEAAGIPVMDGNGRKIDLHALLHLLAGGGDSHPHGAGGHAALGYSPDDEELCGYVAFAVAGVHERAGAAGILA